MVLVVLTLVLLIVLPVLPQGKSALGTLGRRPNYPMRVQILRRKRKEGPLQRQSNHRKTCRLREKVHVQKQDSIMQEWMGHGDNSESSESEGEVPEQKQLRRPVRVEEYTSDGSEDKSRVYLTKQDETNRLGVASRHRQKPGRIPKEIMRIVGMHPVSNIRRKVISGKETYQLVEDDFVHDPSSENIIMSQRGLPADMNFESVLESKNYMRGHNTVQVGSAATGMTQPAEPRPSKHRAAMSAPGNLAKNANLTRRKRIKARFP
eukprot:g53672.t1